MIYAFLLLIFFIILPLAVHRGVVKRVLLIAIVFEVLKLLLVPALGALVTRLNSEALSFILLACLSLIMLPELFIGHTHEPTIPTQTRIVMIIAGIIWNLIPAYLILLGWPGKRLQQT